MPVNTSEIEEEVIVKSNRRRPPLAFLLVVLLALTVISVTSCGTPSFSKDTQDNLETALDETMSESRAPGSLNGIYTPEGTWTVAKGKADLETGLPIKTTDLFRIGSITKTFTATVVLLLCEEGKMSLDDKLSKYEPDFPNSERITIRQLCNMTSGIHTWDEDETMRESVLQDPGKGWTTYELVQWAAQQPLLSEPGTEFHYSNINYFLLGMIIEKVSGNSVEREIKEKITDKLNLENTFLPSEPDFKGETIHGYQEFDGKLEDVTGTPLAKAMNFETAWTAGGMVSTLDDLKVWAKALVTGELLGLEMHEEQMPKDLKEVGGVPTAYGLGVNQVGVWIGHTGAVAGYLANMAYSPEKDAIMVYFFNKFSVRDVEQNEKDLEVLGGYAVKLSKILYPETFRGVGEQQKQ